MAEPRSVSILMFAAYGAATVTIALLVHEVFVGALTNARSMWEVVYSVAGLGGMGFYIFQWRRGRISTRMRNLLAVVAPVAIALMSLFVEGRGF